jgi:hypothetical protein
LSRFDSITAVARALVQQPSCTPCLASTTDLGLDVVGEALDRLLRLAAATLDIQRCPQCGRTVAVYRLTGPAAAGV